MLKRGRKLLIGRKSRLSAKYLPPLPSIKQIIIDYIDRASTYTRVPVKFIEGLKECSHTIELSIPLKRDDGSKDMFKAWRSHHSTHALPLKGGVRYSPYTNKEEIEAVAILMTMKSAVAQIPYGGAHGGIQVDPKLLSLRELENLTRRYAHELSNAGFFGPAIDVLGTDAGTGPREMAWMMETYMNHNPNDTDALACITGKPESLHGLKGSSEATGLGLFYSLKEFLNHDENTVNLDMQPTMEGQRVIIEGFGNVGQHIGRLLSEQGSKIIGVVEEDGGTYNPDGLDFKRLQDHVKEHKTVKGFADGQTYMNKMHIMSQPCEILIPAAVERTITLGNVQHLQCKMILEGASLPLTPKAEEYLIKKGVTVLPDLIVNSGSTIAGYFEYAKNIGRINPGTLTRRWDQKSNLNLLKVFTESTGMHVRQDNALDFLASTEDLINTAIEETVSHTMAEMTAASRRFEISYRDAAYSTALERVYENMRFSQFYST